MTDSSAPKTFFIDDREIDIRDGESIFRAARRLDIKLPHLCYSPKPGYRADGNCRVCTLANRITYYTSMAGCEAAVEGMRHQDDRSEERRVGKECLARCRSRWSPYH